jgi:hypothetical protein
MTKKTIKSIKDQMIITPLESFMDLEILAKKNLLTTSELHSLVTSPMPITNIVS